MGQPAAVPLAGRSIIHRRRAILRAPEPVTVTDFGVGVPRRQEVEFADGSRIWLLRVERNGVPDLFLRELGAPAEGVLVDLRQLVPEISADLPKCATRDVPGLVHFSLRCCFSSVQEMLQIVVALGRPA